MWREPTYFVTRVARDIMLFKVCSKPTYQITQVASYIRTLKGTNPPNPKAPQGDLYSEGGVAPINDSTAVKNDSLNINIKADSLNVGKK